MYVLTLIKNIYGEASIGIQHRNMPDEDSLSLVLDREALGNFIDDLLDIYNEGDVDE
jgi:hypothetical protein